MNAQLLASIRTVHGRDTCHWFLEQVVCDYHRGFADGLEANEGEMRAALRTAQRALLLLQKVRLGSHFREPVEEALAEVTRVLLAGRDGRNESEAT